jgi:hypothetical protein
MDAPGRATHDLTGAILPDGQPVVQFSAGPEVLVLQPGETEYEYRDCYGDRFDSAYSGARSRRAKPLEEVPAHYAGGQACHTPGVFNATEFADESRGMLTVLASRSDASEPQASVSFVHQVHQAGHFELQLPADLPPRFGGRFNEARFAHAAGGALVYPEAVFDLPEDPKALDEQIKAKPGMVVAEVALFPETGVPVYGVPFTETAIDRRQPPDHRHLYLFRRCARFVCWRKDGRLGNEMP